MLYVPLLFYLFDKFKEGKEEPKKEEAPPSKPAPHHADD
jgi:hypothetical protein